MTRDMTLCRRSARPSLNPSLTLSLSLAVVLICNAVHAQGHAAD